MRIKSLFLILTVSSMMSFIAKADNSALETCRQQGARLLEDLNKPERSLMGDNLGSCLSNFIQLNSGLNHVKAHDKCGLICWGAKKAAEKFGDAKRYLKELEAELTGEMVSKIEAQAEKPLKEIVEESYNKHAVVNKGEAGGYTVFNGILLDVIHFYMSAEVIDVGLEEVEGIDEEVGQMEDKLADCLSAVKSKEGIKTCVSKFQSNSIFKIGELTLDVNLSKHFQDEVGREDYESLKEFAVHEYNKCGVSYYFNLDEKEASDAEKGKACVFSAVLEAFSLVVKSVISSKTEMSTEEVDKTVIDLISACGEYDFLGMENTVKYNELQKFSQKSYVEYLLRCKSSVKEGAVGAVGVKTIAGNTVVADLLGVQQADAFAKEVISEGLPECSEKMNGQGELEKCENYLYAKTASKIFPKILNEKFKDFKSEFEVLTDDLINKSINSAQATLDSCNIENQKNFETFLALSESEVDVLVSSCVKSAILASLQDVIKVYLESEISNNKILIKYGISFGARKKDELKKSFTKCASDNISVDNGLSSVVASAETFLDICVLKIMKKVTLDTLELIVEKELRKMGVPFAKTSEVINEYKSEKENLFEKIKNSPTQVDLEKILDSADTEMIKGLSGLIIEFLINEKSPIRFSDDILSKLVKKGKQSFLSCIKSKDTEVCSDLVEGEVTTLGVELYMPVILNEKLQAYRAEYPFLNGEFIKRSTQNAKKELSSCFEWFRDSTKKTSADRQAATCTKKTLLKTVGEIVDVYINIEVAKNKTLKKYGIGFNEQEKAALKNDFNECASSNVSVKEGLESVLRDSETFLDKCTSDIMRKIALNKMDVILKKELISLGLSPSDAVVIVKNYRGQKGNAFSAIQHAKPEHLERTLGSLDKKIALDLAEEILRRLIASKSPIKLSPDQMNRLVAKGKQSLEACIHQKPISYCAKPAEKDIMILAVQLYLPSAVATEFKGSVSKWISPQQFKSLKMSELMSVSMKKQEGYHVAHAIVQALDRGSSMDSIKKLPVAREFIANAILSSKWRVDAIANFIIQKELNDFVKQPKNFLTKIGIKVFYANGRYPGLKWVNIKDNAYGLEVMKLFKGYLRKIVVSGYELTKSDLKRLQKLVQRAVQEYSNIENNVAE